MRIGFLPHLDPSGGGTYHYGLTMMKALAHLQKGGLADEIVLLEYDGAPAVEEGLVPRDWRRLPLRENESPSRVSAVIDAVDRIGKRFIGSTAYESIKRRAKWYTHRAMHPFQRPGGEGAGDERYKVHGRPHLARWLRRCGIDWVLVTEPVPWIFEAGLPYVMAVHDLQHRLQPQFPEVSENGEGERREYVFRNGVCMATLVLVDSDTGREDVLHCYAEHGVTNDRVKVLPFLPALPEPTLTAAEAEAVVVGFELTRPYLFYPAQLWPHKNHVRLVEAIGRLAQTDGLRIDLVLTGGAADELRRDVLFQIDAASEKLGIQTQLHHLGHISATEMEALYVGARALVMPTFFGPTNIPPIEAWVFGCPVITSDIRGIREQMGEAAELVDPGDVASIAQGIRRVWEDPGLRANLIARGAGRLAMYSAHDYEDRLMQVLDETRERVGAQCPQHALEQPSE